MSLEGHTGAQQLYKEHGEIAGRGKGNARTEMRKLLALGECREVSLGQEGSSTSCVLAHTHGRQYMILSLSL